MQTYLTRFDEQYKGKQTVDIQIFDETPLTIKFSRNNQTGEVCSCMEISNQAKQKTKNGWEYISCDRAKCQYRQKNEQGKAACNRIAWFKFLIPSVCKDRIFLMRITGQTSINRLDDYFKLQKAQGNSLKGFYTLFLKQEKQSNYLGKTFNNYVLDILKKDDFTSKNTIPQNVEKKEHESTGHDQNVNNAVEKITPSEISSSEENTKTIEIPEEKATDKSTEKTTKKTQSKTTKGKSKKSDDTKKDTDNKEKEETITDDELKNCYALLSTSHEMIANKDYLVGEFTDMKDNVSNIAIRPEDAIELEKCDLGTFVRLEVSEIKGIKFAIKLEFIEKRLKKVAA